jgi:hypothetical protein
MCVFSKPVPETQESIAEGVRLGSSEFSYFITKFGLQRCGAFMVWIFSAAGACKTAGGSE